MMSETNENDVLNYLDIGPHVKENSDNIFFVETSYERTKFSERALCAFESAAMYNPEKAVFVVVDEKIQLSHIPKYLRKV